MIAFMEWVGEWLRTWMPYSDQVTVGYVLRAFAQAYLLFFSIKNYWSKTKLMSIDAELALITCATCIVMAIGLGDELIGMILFLLFGQRGGM